ncbi:hypothetical protein CL620_05025 [archaeon]|nr:hypothetical protein [archaeon]|tara:strand:+ start:432 stop:638 length:207 start_codon:yes stop_codon:yes gene_type:complete
MNKTYIKDVIERAVWTGLQSFLAIFTVTDLASFEAAIVAGAGALLSVIKSVVATQVGDPDTASTLRKG